MAASIQLTQSALTLTDVRSITVTEVAQDQTTGEYVRELRIFGGDSEPTPPITGIDQPPSAQGRLLLTIRLITSNRNRIQIAVPSLEF